MGAAGTAEWHQSEKWIGVNCVLEIQGHRTTATCLSRCHRRRPRSATGFTDSLRGWKQVTSLRGEPKRGEKEKPGIDASVNSFTRCLQRVFLQSRLSVGIFWALLWLFFSLHLVLLNASRVGNWHAAKGATSINALDYGERRGGGPKQWRRDAESTHQRSRRRRRHRFDSNVVKQYRSSTSGFICVVKRTLVTGLSQLERQKRRDESWVPKILNGGDLGDGTDDSKDL